VQVPVRMWYRCTHPTDTYTLETHYKFARGCTMHLPI